MSSFAWRSAYTSLYDIAAPAAVLAVGDFSDIIFYLSI